MLWTEHASARALRRTPAIWSIWSLTMPSLRFRRRPSSHASWTCRGTPTFDTGATPSEPEMLPEGRMTALAAVQSEDTAPPHSGRIRGRGGQSRWQVGVLRPAAEPPGTLPLPALPNFGRRDGGLGVGNFTAPWGLECGPGRAHRTWPQTHGIPGKVRRKPGSVRTEGQTGVFPDPSLRRRICPDPRQAPLQCIA